MLIRIEAQEPDVLDPLPMRLHEGGYLTIRHNRHWFPRRLNELGELFTALQDARQNALNQRSHHGQQTESQKENV